jgi:hypothetical protein
MSEDVDGHITERYDIYKRLGKGECKTINKINFIYKKIVFLMKLENKKWK